MQMAHVRFTNTLEALRECYEHWDDEDVGKEEQKARVRLYYFCQKVVDVFDPEDYE